MAEAMRERQLRTYEQRQSAPPSTIIAASWVCQRIVHTRASGKEAKRKSWGVRTSARTWSTEHFAVRHVYSHLRLAAGLHVKRQSSSGEDGDPGVRWKERSQHM